MPIADVLDDAGSGSAYRSAIESQLSHVADPSQTPSALQLEHMAEQQVGYHEFGLNKAHEMVKHFEQKVELSEKTEAALRTLSQESLGKTSEIEHSDDQDFGSFLESYFAQD